MTGSPTEPPLSNEEARCSPPLSPAVRSCSVVRLLTVGDVSDHQYGKVIHADGETGERDVLIAGDAIAHLNDWLNGHRGGRPERPP